MVSNPFGGRVNNRPPQSHRRQQCNTNLVATRPSTQRHPAKPAQLSRARHLPRHARDTPPSARLSAVVVLKSIASLLLRSSNYLPPHHLTAQQTSKTFQRNRQKRSPRALTLSFLLFLPPFDFCFQEQEPEDPSCLPFVALLPRKVV